MKTFSDAVVKELTEMKKLGLHVPPKAIEMASDLNTVEEYSHMRVSDAVDLLIELADLATTGTERNQNGR